jgi:5-methyltetrahydrofolate--homocysteine methyltransferase
MDKTFRLSRLLWQSSPVITDGAWGTELQKRGLALGEPADLWNLTHPEDVEAVARDYVRAGSQIILTNTFRGNPVSLADLGAADKTDLINREGARLSRATAGREVLVFGSLGPTGKNLAKQEIDARTVTDAFKLQAEALANGGADALLFETFSDVEEARLAVRTAKPTGLPIIVSFAFCTGPNLDQTTTGADPETAARAMVEEGADAVGANCGAGPERFHLICRRLKAASALPIWIKPSAGQPSLVDSGPVYSMTPAAFAAHLSALIDAGASFVGGCCGTNPEFIGALVKAAEIPRAL